MSETHNAKLSFLDSLAHLFKKKEEAPPPHPEARDAQARAASGFESLEKDFEAAVHNLDRKVEEHMRQARKRGEATGLGGVSADEREAEREKRLASARRSMREDIEKLHARLGTGLDSAALDAIAKDLRELDERTNRGHESRDLLGRARWAMAERFQREAGELAVARIVDLIGQAKMDWPDPTHYRSTATPEEIERSRRRRLAEVRESFMAQSLGRTAERMLGVVTAWGSDYPDRSSPLWEETALEGVAAGIRGELVKEFVEAITHDREALLAELEKSIGKEVSQLSEKVRSLSSIEQANHAVASALRVVDEVAPEIAWTHVSQEVPRARGEWGS